MVTGVILTRNNEDTISAFLEQLGFCSEILIIDNESSDQTGTIAKRMGATVINDPANDFQDFAKKRNIALRMAANDWVLFLDTDEQITDDLQKAILEAIQTNEKKAYRIKRRDFFWGKELKFGETSSARSEGIIRLVRKDSGTWKGNVHEKFISHYPIGMLNGYINHFPHQSIVQFLKKVNFYSTIRSRELHKSGRKPSIIGIVFVPPLKFMYTYVCKLGFLDGAEGFVYSFMMSLHSFLARSKAYMED